MQSTVPRAVLYGLFMLSGAAGVGYQAVWARLFTNGLGHEMPAVLAIVAAFFVGLAAGAWALDPKIASSARPARWYAFLELVIGIWGAVSALLIPVINNQALRFTGIDAAPARHWLTAFAFPTITLLPATVAMGATWPAMERFAAGLARERKVVGALYAANTFGAVAGVGVSTLMLMPFFGFRRTLFIFSAANLLCAVVSAWLAKGRAVATFPEARTTKNGSAMIGLRLTVFATGLLGIGYEVTGVRVLSQVLENTIYTFAAALAVFLAGTAIGAVVYQRVLRRAGSDAFRSWVLLAAAAACLGGLFALARADDMYQVLRSAFPENVATAMGAELVTAAAVFFVPTLLMGVLFSHLIQGASVRYGSVGRAIALNSLGSALAPVAFGLLLIPVFGTGWTIKIIVVTYVALAVIAPGPARILAGVMIVALALLGPAALQKTEAPFQGKLLEYREGAMDSVAVVQHPDGNRSLLVNNRFTMGGTGAAAAERRHAHLPLLLHPNPKRALFLGLGTGITFAAAGDYPGLRADGVELVPEIVAVLPRFEPENAMPGLGRELKIYVADARRFVRTADALYDVIVADLFHPARDGAGTLYTREHFEAIRARLASGGIFCQWLPLYQLDEPTLQMITRTFLDVFPDATAWLLRFNVDTPVLGLIGDVGSRHYSADYFERRTAQMSTLRERLNAAQLRNAFELFGCFLADNEQLRTFADKAAVTTDDRPLVIFRAPRLSYEPDVRPYGRLLGLLSRFEPKPDSILTANGTSPREAAFPDELKAYIGARNLYLRGLIDENEGRSAQALGAFLESVRRSEPFTLAYAHCLTLASQQMKENPAAARSILEALEKAQPNRPIARQLLDRMEKK